jgi:hypothetical protein
MSDAEAKPSASTTARATPASTAAAAAAAKAEEDAEWGDAYAPVARTVGMGMPPHWGAVAGAGGATPGPVHPQVRPPPAPAPGRAPVYTTIHPRAAVPGSNPLKPPLNFMDELNLVCQSRLQRRGAELM